MAVFNRIIMSLVLLVLMVGAILVAFLPDQVIAASLQALQALQFNLNPATRLGIGVLGLMIAALLLLLMLAEVRPPARHAVVVAQSTGGTAELTIESVALRVKRAAEAIDGVREASPTVRSRGKAVDILIRLSTDSDIDLPRKTEEVIQAVRAETETRMGIPVKSLRVTVRHASDRRGSPPAVPTIPPAPPKSGLEL